MTATVRVVVNADDFGLTDGVNESIVACHLAGSVTSTTLMVNQRAAAEAAALARRHPGLSVGLHFTLTCGRPLSPPDRVRSLVGADGAFQSRGALLRRWATGRLAAAEVEAELRAQRARMAELGLRPTHYDSHQHVHAAPPIFAAVARLAAEERVPLRVPWRWPGRPARTTVPRRAATAALGWLVRASALRLPPGVATNDGLCSVFDLGVPPTSLTPDHYRALLAAYDRGTIELMVHPAVVTDELRALTAITAVSEVEDRLLRAPAWRAALEDAGATLVTYREVGR